MCYVSNCNAFHLSIKISISLYHNRVLKERIDNPNKDLSSYNINEAVALMAYARRVGPQTFRNCSDPDRAAKALLKEVPFPIGSYIPDELDRNIKSMGIINAMLRYLIPHGNMFVVLLIHYYRRLHEQNLLGFAASAVGIGLTGGIHMYRIGTKETKHMTIYGLSNFIKVNRVVAFAHAVINGYWHIMIDSTRYFIVGGKKIFYGPDWIITSCHGCHLQCFKNETLEGSEFNDRNGRTCTVCADRCIALNHSTPSDQSVNKANERCQGSTLVKVPSSMTRSGNEERFLFLQCECCNLGGNPGNNSCSFVKNVINLGGDPNLIAHEVNGRCTLIGHVESLEERRTNFAQMDRHPSTSQSSPRQEEDVITPSLELENSSTEVNLAGKLDDVISIPCCSLSHPNLASLSTQIETAMVVFDVETSDVNVEKAHIIEMASVVPKNNVDSETPHSRSFQCKLR